MPGHSLVSIVTPCFNPGARLERCLDSVAAQTHPNIEHIVVDGGSTDGTVELLRERKVQFISEPDDGQTNALNKGFALAGGEWLGWLNADDELTPRATELAMEAAATHPGAGWIYGKCEFRGPDETFVWTPPARVDAKTISERNVFAQPGTLVARWAQDRIGPLDESLDLVMDVDLWLGLIDLQVPSVFVPEILALFEIHDASKTGSVPAPEWDLELARVMEKRGHTSDAAALLGRVAASRARGDRRAVEADALRPEIEASLAYAREHALEVDARTVRAAAWAEAAEREFYGSPRRIRHLLRPEPWTVGRSRVKLLRMLGGSATRLVRGRTVRARR